MQEMNENSRMIIHKSKNKENKKKKILVISIFSVIILAFAILYLCKIPIIKYQGQEIETVEYGTTYEDKGIKVYKRFKNISDQVIVESNVNLTQLGDYNITYKVPFGGKYKTYTRTVKVVDTEAPKIELKDDSNYKLQYGKN